jgi:hypothetical protein
MYDIIHLCSAIVELTLELVTSKLVPAITISKDVIRVLNLYSE